MEDLDPKGLIRESYRIEGITEAECRSIFLDWAVSFPGTPAEIALAITLLADRHGADAPDHPMTALLREGRAGVSTEGRRGGWRARRTEGSGEPIGA